MRLCISAYAVPSFFFSFLYLLPSIADWKGKWKHRSFWTLSGSPSLVGSPAIARIAQDSGLTPAQAVLRHAQLKGVVPLSGTTDERHMQQDLELENCSLKGSESSWEELKQIMGETDNHSIE